MMDGESLGERTRLVHGTPSYEAYNGKVKFSYLLIFICHVQVHYKVYQPPGSSTQNKGVFNFFEPSIVRELKS